MPLKKNNKLTREEILQRKREAERQRYQRVKNDSQKCEEMKEKERLKYQKKKEKGQRKLVKDMNPREHRSMKKKWKEYCAKYRSKRKTMKEITNTFSTENTPNSVNEDLECSEKCQKINRLSEKRRRRAKKLREKIMEKKNQKIKDLQKKLEKYKKRISRMTKTREKNEIKDPNTKLQKMLDSPDSRKVLVKKAFFGEVLKEQLKKNYSTLKTKRDKQIFTKVISGSLVEKYKLWRYSAGILTYKRVKTSSLIPCLAIPKQTRKDGILKECVLAVQNFYEDDANSRLGAGKKEFVTRKSIKRQKRYLLDSMLSLYKKFKSNNFKISYQTFCRLRPFWVVKPKVNDRDTCLCITHANIDLKLSALHGAKVISYNSHQKLLEDLCCDRYNEQCLSRQCQRCINKTPTYKEFDNSKPLHFKKWIAEKQKFMDAKTKKTRQMTKYLKKTFIVQPNKLIDELHEDLQPKFFCHERNIVHQFNAINTLKKNLSDEDVLIHMDFSENYTTKYGQEIQAIHFGGSRLQISLHTVVVYLKNSTKSYCTASTNLSHSPPAIWMHLQPILKSLPSQIKCIHFLSDGPVAQYRNKTMFYILASKLLQWLPNIQKFSWNFSESGHGKGAPDGVGATCKRTADSIVAAGDDIDNLEKFVNVIQQRCPGVLLYTIDPEDIQAMTDEIEQEAPQLKTFNGTFKVHQVTGNIHNPLLGLNIHPVTLTMRSLSCFCDFDVCEHFKIGSLKYETKPKLTVEDVYTDSE